MEIKEIKQKINKQKKLFLVIITFLFGSLINYSGPLNNLKEENQLKLPNISINNLESSELIELKPTIPDYFLEEEFANYLINTLSIDGSFPNQGSTIKDTYFALKILNLTGNKSIYDTNYLNTFLLNQIGEQGGFKESTSEIETIIDSFYASMCLKEMNKSLSDPLQINLASFFNETSINETIFAESLESNYTSPEIIYYALNTLENIDSSIDILNRDSTYDYLIRSHFNPSYSDSEFGLFNTPQDEKFRTTYYSLLVLNKIGKLNQNRMNIVENIISVNNGTVISNGEESLYFNDNNPFVINSSAGVINFTMQCSQDYLMENLENETFQFTFIGNLSKSLDDKGYFSIFNTNTSLWENITATNDFSSADSDVDRTYHFSSPFLDLNNYTFYGTEGDFERYSLINVFFNDSDNLNEFTLDIEQFLYNYTVFNVSFVSEVVKEYFSSSYFDSTRLDENYYATRILEYLDTSNLLTTNEWDYLSNHVSLLKGDHGGYFIEDSDTFNSLEGTYYALYLYNFTGTYNVSIIQEINEYVIGWRFPDGGFGSSYKTSLPATYRIVKYLNDTGQLTIDLKLKISNYVISCQNPFTKYFNDYNAETNVLGDTYYAFLLSELLSLDTIMGTLDSVASGLISTQSPFGYFGVANNMRDTYFACEILVLAEKQFDLQYFNELYSYIQNLQTYFGGFYMTHFDFEASVEATCYAVEIAKNFGFLELIRIREDEDGNLGIFEYLSNHQHVDYGGFYEDDSRFYVNETIIPSITISMLVCEVLNDLNLLHLVNATGLEVYLQNKIEYFNDLEFLSHNESEVFFDGVKIRCNTFQTYEIIEQVKIYLDVFIDDFQLITGNKFNIYVNASNLRGNLIEECKITINNQQELIDHQNGSYSSGDVIFFDEAGMYDLNFKVEHEIYLNLMVDYVVNIKDVFNLIKLKSIEVQTVWFANKLTLIVPVFNESDDSFLKNCNVSLYDSDGDLIFELNENDDGEYYECDLDYSNWILSDETYSIIVEKDSFRTEILTIHAVILPFGFLFIAFDIIVLSAIVSVIFYRKYGSRYGALLVEKIKNRIGKRVVDIKEKKNEIVEQGQIPIQKDLGDDLGKIKLEDKLSKEIEEDNSSIDKLSKN